MIGKIAAVIGAGIISAVITSVTPEAALDAARGAALRNGPPTPQFDTTVVDRTNKSDRLSIRRHPARGAQNGMSLPKTVPLGCDPVFSPVADPAVAHIFKRCVA